jgi:hypothetical protein
VKHTKILMAIVMLGALALWLLAGNVFAATYSWIHPTTRVGGSPLPLNQISYTLAETGTCNGLEFGELMNGAQIAAPASVFETEFSPGTWCARFFTVDIDGLKSGPSAVVSYIAQADPPNPPGVLHVIWGAAFVARVLPNGRVFFPYDDSKTARYGAPCLAIPGLTEVYGFGLSEGVIAICGY